jgi:hypothetical protein
MITITWPTPQEPIEALSDGQLFIVPNENDFTVYFKCGPLRGVALDGSTENNMTAGDLVLPMQLNSAEVSLSGI